MSALFIILVGLTMTLFSDKMFISHRCLRSLMPNLIKKSWTVSNLYVYVPYSIVRNKHRLRLLLLQIFSSFTFILFGKFAMPYVYSFCKTFLRLFRTLEYWVPTISDDFYPTTSNILELFWTPLPTLKSEVIYGRSL